MDKKVVYFNTVSMLPTDMANFVELIKCNELEAELDSHKAEKYRIEIVKED